MRKKLISAFLPLFFLAYPSVDNFKTSALLSQFDSYSAAEVDKAQPVAMTPTSPKPIFPPMFGVSDVPPA